MKSFNLISKSKGNKKNVSYFIKTNKNYLIGNIDYSLNIFTSNKYTINKHLKFNVNVSNNVYNNILYNYKNIND